MKQGSGQHTKRVVFGLTLILFVSGYLLVVKAGVSDVRQLFSFLVASYLVVWGGYALATTIPRDEIRTQFVLLTFSLGMGLLLVELPAWFRVIDYRELFAVTGSQPWERPRYVPDMELLAKPEPHYSVKMQFSRGNIGHVLCLPPYPSEPFELKYDQNGFRNEGDLRTAEIAVIGDSYIESPMIPASQLATTRLAEETQQVVANFGQSGYGPQQELAVLKRYALPLHPKTVVWVFYEGNDLLDARGYPDSVSLLRSQWDSLDSYWNRAFTKNALLWLTRTLNGCVPNPHEKPQAARAVMIDATGQEHRVYVKGRSHSVSLTAQEVDDLQNTVAAIEEAYRLVQQEGARFVVAFAPHAFRVYHDIVSFQGIGGGITRWDLNDLPERLRQMMAEISPDIQYVDLTPALQSAARNSTLVFLPDDTHWTKEGHQVVAAALAETVKDNSPEYAKQTSPQRPTPTSRSLLTSGALMVRNLDGTIRYWSHGAEKLYGWEPKEVLGSSSHQLLHTVFPVPLRVIQEQLQRKGHWEGQLIHRRRDGSKVTVMSAWDLQQNPTAVDRSITVVEVNGQAQS
ncbi:MAG: PAS domain S-box protein [Nitrospira sp.]